MSEVTYPTPEKIIEYNLLTLDFIKVKKADQSKILNKAAIIKIVQECEDKDGDVYDKALVLLKGLIQRHPFASGNRRTAFIVTKDFILKNKGKFLIANEPENAKIMRGIRENYYTEEEIKEWMKNGKIREFRR